MSKRIYQYAFTKNEVDRMKNYLQHGVLPEGSYGVLKRFKARCEGFDVVHGELVYRPEPSKTLVVVSKEETPVKLKELLARDELTAKGVNQTMWWIHDHYIGISRNEIVEQLKKNPTYQLSFGRRKMASRAYMLSAPFQYWACDLIECVYYAGSNNNYNYILTVIDLFSHFVWLRGIKKKTAEAVTEGFQSIIHSNPTPMFPTFLVSDNGGEFKKELAVYLTHHGVKLLNTPSHRPQVTVEQANLQVRRQMRTWFIKTNSLNWRSHLQHIADSMNTNKNKTLGV